MRRRIVFVLTNFILIIGLFFASEPLIIQPIPGLSQDFIRGADISMLGEIEKHGGVYYGRDGKQDDLLSILKKEGVNWIRLRLWNNPASPKAVIKDGKVIAKKGDLPGGGNNDLAQTIAIAKRAKDMGFKFLLDFHYSDFWADPGKQEKPNAWKNLSGKALEKAVYNFTKETILALIQAGAAPDMVQIGNEVNGGMLWPDGKTWKGDDDSKIGGMNGFINLLKNAAQGVRDATKGKKAVKIAIHLADGGDNELYRSVFDPLTKAKVDFDIIGLSFYTYWHGSIASLSKNLVDLAKRYNKELVVMETAYAFTEEDGDSQGNVFRVYDDDSSGYIPSVQGQTTAIRDVMAAVAGVKGGLGVFYWEPGWIPVEGAGWFVGEGNNWENQALFDFNGRALESLSVFSQVYKTSSATIVPIRADSIEVRTAPKTPPQLPTQIKLVFNDGSLRLADVSWESHDWKSEINEREVKIQGKATAKAPYSGDLQVFAVVSISTKKN